MKNFLVVDDSYTIREMVSSCIQDEGKTIFKATDGTEALSIAKNNACDFVVTDFNMPNMDGLTLVTELRKLPQYKTTPILILATESSPELKQKGRDVGVTGWILKPINLDTFADIVEQVINRHKQ
mgnify:CR=1 FL=1